MINSVRYMSPNPVTIQEVADRVNYVLSTFDKIDTEKLNLDCRFDKVRIRKNIWNILKTNFKGKHIQNR